MTPTSRTEEEIRAIVLDAIHSFAPEADLKTLDPTASLRDQVDLDSMDFLNLMVKLHKTLEVEIPESDYAKLSTLKACVSYLKAKLDSARASA